MFHVNAWGTPYAAAMVGCSMVLPGPMLDGASLVQLIDQYKVTTALGVPTIWQGLLTAAKQSGSKLDSLKRNVVGGAACPPSMLKTFKDDFQCETIHAWGMTETSPLGVVNQLKAKHLQLDDSAQSSKAAHHSGSAFEFVMLKRAVQNWLQMDKPQDICKLKGTGS